MNKLQPALNVDGQEQKVAAAKKEKQRLYVIEGQANKEKNVEPKKEKTPFYADINFWIRAAAVIMLLLMGCWFYAVLG